MGATFLRSIKDRAKDMLPIRPQYISRTMTIRLAALRSLVMPVDMPTVPMAEKTSKHILHYQLRLEIRDGYGPR